MHRLVILSLLLAWIAPAPAASLDAFVASHARENGFSGTVLVREPGKDALVASFGPAERVFGTPNARDTRYWIASVTKLFTATLILQLHEQGKLDLQAPIRTYLPDYAGMGGDSIAVHHLLNHTSGLPSYENITDSASAIRDGMPVYQLPHDLDTLVAKYCSGPPTSAPGAAFSYNNADYVLLGRIVERVAGKPFDAVLEERILRPLQLADTGMLRQPTIVPRLASTYFTRDGFGLVNALPVYPENWHAAGGMYSTVDDLATFADALFGARLLTRESVDLLLTPALDEYGYGLWSYTANVGGARQRVAKRPGSIMGAQAQLYRVIDRNITVVLLANTDAADLDAFVAAISKRLAP